jgi:hypothetical protein
MTTTAATPPGQQRHEVTESMSHRQVLEALSGLLLGMFVAILSSTVVSNALPVIVPTCTHPVRLHLGGYGVAARDDDLHAPVGQLADLYSRKLLVQLALVILVAASAEHLSWGVYRQEGANRDDHGEQGQDGDQRAHREKTRASNGVASLKCDGTPRHRCIETRNTSPSEAPANVPTSSRRPSPTPGSARS